MVSLFLAKLILSTCAADSLSSSSLIVDEAPNEPRPYVLLRNTGLTVALGQGILRYQVTGNISEQSFAMITQSAPQSSILAVLPHIHRQTYENFFVQKGRVQMWAWQNETGGQEFSRVMTDGDYAVIPHDTLHTFQFLEPETELTFIVQPGGFERLFFALSDSVFSTSTRASFVPEENLNPPGAGNDPDILSELEVYDVYFRPEYSPTHNGNNALAKDSSSAAFVAKDWSEKYLNTEEGCYQIIQPLATPVQTDGNMTMGTLILSPRFPNETVPVYNLNAPTSLLVREGQLTLDIHQYESLTIHSGDSAFIPPNVSFSYYSKSAMTRVMYVSGGAAALDSVLLRDAIPWNYTTYPTYAGYGRIGHGNETLAR
ncbi:RmlC-like cupin [Ilyonectria robusta]|uniref:RmlC-like cupin n=1 Tax=Ilyonectria robusta TaxID=1079257 RepID=UPI001E8EBF11|nr:RmlC-like cupin [Ilyonectria robusta]KAH8652889.1 RmlC-like cupin [Ilyonectria robusta]